jgi:hypothetical protein
VAQRVALQKSNASSHFLNSLTAFTTHLITKAEAYESLVTVLEEYLFKHAATEHAAFLQYLPSASRDVYTRQPTSEITRTSIRSAEISSSALSARCTPETPRKHLPVSSLHDFNGIIASDFYITYFAGVILNFAP